MIKRQEETHIKPAACIEIKLSNAPAISKGLLHCIDDLKPKHKLIVKPQSETYTTQHGIQVTGLKSFLKEQLPLIQ
jgi:pyridoxine 5'-phosphate synthase PdxJ